MDSGISCSASLSKLDALFATISSGVIAAQKALRPRTNPSIWQICIRLWLLICRGYNNAITSPLSQFQPQSLTTAPTVD